MARVFGPFHALESNEFARQILAEPCADDRIAFQFFDRFEKILRQQLDAFCIELLARELIEVDVVRLARIEFTVDAIKARRDHRRGDQIGIAAGIGQAYLEPAVRDAYAGRAVVVAVRDVRWRPGSAGQ